jgi:hypothetical protein
MKKLLQLASITLLFLFHSTGYAESSTALDDYIVHYNALSTESLPPSVARVYGITRSQNRGLLNISVLKKGEGFEGVEASIDVSATNLTGQLRKIKLRKINEDNAVYYIGEFSVTDQETLDFVIEVTTADNKSTTLRLRQQFFTN